MPDHAARAIDPIYQAASEIERLRRGGAELGRILDRTLTDVLAASGRDDVIGEDGDGDWALVWETLAGLRPRAEKAEAERDRLAATVARVRALDTGYQQGGGNFHAYCISPVRLRAALAADPTEGAGDD